MNWANVIFIIFSIFQTLNNLEIYSGIWDVVYLWIGIASIIFVLVYNSRNDKIIETGVALFIIHSFKIFDKNLKPLDFIFVHGLVYLMLLYLLIKIYNKKSPLPKKDLFNASLLLFSGVAFLSTFHSVCIYNALQQYLVFIDFLIVTFIIANYFTKEGQIRLLISIFFIIAVVLMGLTIFRSRAIGFDRLLSSRITVDRIHANSIAGYFNSIILIAIPVCLVAKKIIIRGAYFLLIAISLIFSLLAFSRLGIFSLISCCVMLAALISYKKKRQYIYENKVILAIILLSLIIFLTPKINSTLLKRISDTGSNNVNFYSCLVTLEAIKDKPFLGAGFDNNYFLANYGDIPFLNTKTYNLSLETTRTLLHCSPHSLFLGITWALGICGLIGFLIVIFITISNAWYVIRQEGDSYQSRIVLGCLLAMASMLIHGIMTMTFHFTVLPVIFWIMIGIIMAVRNFKIETKPQGVNRFVFTILILFISFLGLAVVALPVLSESKYKSAVAYTKKGDTEKAIDETKKAITLNPINPAYFLYLRDLYIKKDMKKEAVDVSIKLISLKRYYAPYYVKLGELYSDLKLYSLAIEEFKKAIEFDKLGSQKGEHYSKLIALYLDLGMQKEAGDLYKDAIRLAPSLKEAEFVKGTEKVQKGSAP